MRLHYLQTQNSPSKLVPVLHKLLPKMTDQSLPTLTKSMLKNGKYRNPWPDFVQPGPSSLLNMAFRHTDRSNIPNQQVQYFICIYIYTSKEKLRDICTGAHYKHHYFQNIRSGCMAGVTGLGDGKLLITTCISHMERQVW